MTSPTFLTLKVETQFFLLFYTPSSRSIPQIGFQPLFSFPVFIHHRGAERIVIYKYIHPFIWQIFAGCLLCPKHYTRHDILSRGNQLRKIWTCHTSAQNLFTPYCQQDKMQFLSMVYKTLQNLIPGKLPNLSSYHHDSPPPHTQKHTRHTQTHIWHFSDSKQPIICHTRQTLMPWLLGIPCYHCPEFSFHSPLHVLQNPECSSAIQEKKLS